MRLFGGQLLSPCSPLPRPSSEEELTALFSGLLTRLHVLVVGPGFVLFSPTFLTKHRPDVSNSLGRTPTMQLAAKVAIRLAREKGLYIVVDADGIWLVQLEPEVIKGYQKCVLTPNVVEFQRLCQVVVSSRLLSLLHAAIPWNLMFPIILSAPRNKRR